jgi:hypothetical protein
MKFSSVLFFAAILVLFPGCNSLDNPFAGIFHHKDERVYNPQTGAWEYPNQKATPTPKSAAVASALNSPGSSQTSGEGRNADGHGGNWVERHDPGQPLAPASQPVAASNAPAAAAAPASGAAPAASASAAPPPAPTPAPARPPKATGYYNTATGKIEWQNGGAMTAAAAPAVPVKHWWWPF